MPDPPARRRAGLAAALGLLALFLAVASPLAEAAQVYVPPSVPSTAVPVAFTGLAPGTEVRIEVAGERVVRRPSGAEYTATVNGVGEGLHAWTVEVRDSFGTQSFGGHVHVDAGVPDLAEAVEGLRAAVADLREQAESGNATLEALGGRLAGLLASQSDVLEALASMDEAPDTHARTARTAGVAATSATAGALLLLGASAILLLQTHRRHRELMVLMLAFCAKAGLTGDSAEFSRALQALDGPETGPKPGP